MKKLTIKQERFAELVVKLGNQSEAYRQAYDVSPNTKNEVIAVKASELMAKGNVSVRVEELKKEQREANKIDRQWIIDKHKEVISWYVELKEFASREELTKEERSRVFMLKDLIKGSDFRGSLDSITKMLGLNEPDKIETKDTSHKSEWGS